MMDLRTEQERTDDYIELCGGQARADQLARIHHTSYPSFRGAWQSKSRDQVFRERAIVEGFTHGQVTALLELQQ
jgi:hypothetical protein